MRYLSVCSGIEAATVAWHPLGWRPWAFSEVDPFPSRVLAHRLPEVPNFGDMTKFMEWRDATIDVLVGGTPCQSFSIAGLRKGLDDPRGNLMLTYLAIARRYRPKWLVWENVPGVLSSNGGRDFGTFLAGLGQLGYGFAYRVLDAQYVRVDSHPRAVPQRRRRVFVVGCLGDWASAAAVLFDRESLQWDHPPRREAGKIVAPTISSRTTGGGGLGAGFDLDGGLIHTFDRQSSGEYGDEPVASTVSARDYKSAADLVAHTLSAARGNAPANAADLETYIPVANVAVRRLTPEECEALQGFPRGWTDIGNGKGRPTPDGPRYKAIGNSMAVNVMRWIGERIVMVEAIQKEILAKEAAE